MRLSGDLVYAGIHINLLNSLNKILLISFVEIGDFKGQLM